jgi:hypothetical protein
MATASDVKPTERPERASPAKRSQPRKSTGTSTPSKRTGATGAKATGVTAAKATGKRTGAAGAKATGATAAKARTASLTLPFVTAEFRVPDVHVPSIHVPHPTLPSAHMPSAHLPRPHVPHVSGDLTNAARVARSYIPPRDQLALYAGLGAGAVAGLIEWPVAAAVAAGTFVAKRAHSAGGPRLSSVRKSTT